MYSLMVVDDEQIVLDAVQFIVEKYMDNVTILATAKSGREALEKVDDAKPDIMLVDIQMPGINGLEVIGRVMEQYKSIEFIVISAYEEFAFAKEALSLGVREYILKPINRYKLVDSIERAIGDIEKKRKLRRQEIDNRERIDRMMPILEQSFIYSVLLDKDFAMDIPELMDTFNLSHDCGYIMIIECGHDRGKIDHYIIRDTLKLRCKCIIGPFIMNRSIVFVSSEKGIDEERDNRLSADLAKYTISTIEKKADVKLRIGIGGCRAIENLSASYDEAIRALQSQKGGRIIHIMDVAHDSTDGFEVIRGKHRDLLSYIESGDIEETDRLLDEFTYSLYGRYIKIKASNSSSEDGVRNAFAELMVKVYGIAWDMGIPGDELIDYDTYLSETLSKGNYSEIEDWCRTRILHITRKIKDKRLNMLSKPIQTAKEYMDDNFHRELYLEDLSLRVGMSPQYFSRMFKEETGDNFKDYLTNLRIEKAKELILTTDKSIKEICFQVGYGDPNYFSRLFTKAVGVPPTRYSERTRN